MSDEEVIERLRDWPFMGKAMATAAADRIKQLAAINEALIAERDEAWKRAAHAEEMWGRAEVKLSESEAKMAIYKDALKHIAKHDTQMWAIKALSDAKGDDDE